MQHQIKFGSRNIVFTLEYRNRKSLGIKVHPDKKVEVIAPIMAREAQVFEKVRLKAAWILKQINYFNKYNHSTKPRRFVNGETHLYLGRQYRLKIISYKEEIVKAYRGQLRIHTLNIKSEALHEQLDCWYRRKAVFIFNEMLEEVFPKFKRFKITKPKLTVRKMAKRWGSCTPSGNIVLNTELIKAPKGCIEYVIVHELAHLVHYNHTKAFFNLLNRLMPDWEKWKNKLEFTLAV